MDPFTDESSADQPGETPTPQPTDPTDPAQHKTPSLNLDPELETDSVFNGDDNEVTGEGKPTPSLRVRAWNAGYRLTSTDNGWVATKR